MKMETEGSGRQLKKGKERRARGARGSSADTGHLGRAENSKGIRLWVIVHDPSD